MPEDGFWNPVTRRLAYAETIALVIFLTKVGSVVDSTYDAYTHMMFGSHYLLDWWAAVDNRWYLGFEVTTYPPLAHQVLAILTAPVYHLTSLSMLDSFELAYLAISCVLTLAFPYAVFRFSELFTSRRAAANAGIVAAVFSGWWTLLAVFGQYPTFFAIVLVLFGGVFLHSHLTRPSITTGVMTVLLTALVPLTHHFSTISILFGAYAVVVADTARDVESVKTSVRRGLPVAVVAVLVVVVALYPFVEFLLTGPSQPTIPHMSRRSWLEGDVLDRTQFDFVLWSGGVLLLAIPATISTARKNRPLIVALGFGLLFGLLSLGQTTPLPSLVYGGLAETLTYYRFAVWGGVLVLPVIGATIHRQLDADRRRSIVVSALVVAVIVAIVVANLVTATAGIAPPTEPRDESTEAIETFMESDQHFKWRYLTLGMPTKLGAIGVAAPHAQTIDGYYNTGRSPEKLPRLFHSSTSQLSSVKHQSEEARATLRHYLENHEQFNVKFVFSSDPYYADFLRDAGFEVLYDWEQRGLRVWYYPEVEQFTQTPPDPVEGHTGYAWGLVPIGCLLGAIALRTRMAADGEYSQAIISRYPRDRDAVLPLRKRTRNLALLLFVLLTLSAITIGSGQGAILSERSAALDPQQDRVVHYDFDENASHVPNQAGAEYNGSLSGDVQYVPRDGGLAVQFNGSSDRVTVANSTALSTRHPVTVGFTLKLDHEQEGNLLGNYGSYWFWVSGNHVYFSVMSNGTRVAETRAEVPIGEWTSVVGTYDNESGMKLFVDGNVIGSVGGTNESLNQTDGNLTINMGEWKNGVNGSIDAFSLWNRSLSTDEVRELQQRDDRAETASPLVKTGLAVFLFLIIVGVTARD